MGKHTHSENISFNLGDTIVKSEDSVKLLGVTIDFKLDFDEHILNVCKKASRQLDVLKGISGHLCRLRRINVYYSFIIQILIIAPSPGIFVEKNIQKGRENTRKGPSIYL